MARNDTMADLVRSQGSLGEHVFLVSDEERLTFGDAEHRSRRIAAGLLAANVRRGSRVGILMGNTVDFALTFLAVTRIGAVALPFSTLSTTPELTGILDNSDTEFLISAATYRSRDLAPLLASAIGSEIAGPLRLPDIPALRRVWIGINGLESIDDDTAVAAAEAAVWPADDLVVIHTSGSTSAPKGVVHTHGAIIRNMRRQNALRGLAPTDRVHANSPFFWVGGLAYSFVATFAAGCRLICSSAPPAQMLDLLERERPNIVNGVATTVLALANDPSFAGRDMSFIEQGNLYPVMPPALRPDDPELRYNLLGMTEAGSVCLYARDEGDLPEHKRGSFGRTVPGIEARVVDTDSGHDASSGELWLRGPNIMQGYIGRERHETFTEDGWYRTGDMVRVDNDGDIFFHGRQGDIIKTSGANVSPREVEAAISDVLSGQSAIVVGLPDADRGQVVAAVIIGSRRIDIQALRASLAATLSPYKIPRQFFLLPENQIPTLSSGKVDLRGLINLVQSLSGSPSS